MATYPYGSTREVERPNGAGANVEPAQPGTSEPEREATPNQPEVSSPTESRPRDDTQDGRTIDPANVSAKAQQRAKAAERQRVRTNKYQRDYGRRKRAERKAAGTEAPVATSRKAATQATLDLTHILYSLHTMGSVLLQIPSLVITEEEAKHLAAAITRVSELYEVPILDEKARAWINLGLVGVQVYGTRIAAAMVERKKKAPAPPPMVITPFRPHPTPQQPIPPMEAYAEEVSSGQA